MKIENITACVFDAYGTLFDVNSAAAKCKEKLGDTTIITDLLIFELLQF